MNRRDWLTAAAVASGSALSMMRLQQHKYSRDLRPKRSRVAVLHTDQYSDKLDEVVYDGLRLFNLNVRGKSILLKPNIVEYIPGKPVNTDTQLIGAAVEAFLRLDAASVTVGEGPGHHRDTDLLLYETGLSDQLAHRKIVIADAVIGMEGDGPLNGTARRMNQIVLSDDPVAADVMSARAIGVMPEQITYIQEAARFLGNPRAHDIL